MMKISLVYTSRRARYIPQVVDTWRRAAARPERVEVVVSVDADYTDGLVAQARLTDVVAVVNKGPSTCVAGWNAGAAAATGDLLIAVADDFLPPPRWDQELEEAGPHEWWKEERTVWVSDGYNQDIFTLGIVTRRRYRRFGYIFYPGYESLFCDTELSATAHLDGVVLDARHLLFEHLHPDCRKRARDEVDLEHASTGRWKRGEMLFKLRSETGFPLDAGPRAELLDAAYLDPRFVLCVQAIRDDLCLADVVERIVSDAAGRVTGVFIFSPDEYWDGTPQTASDRAELEEAMRLIRQTLTDVVEVALIPQPVAAHRLPGLSRIQVETRVRNAALEEIRRRGHLHILVADGDELWRRGLFDQLVQFVQERRPASVFTGMVPVIGLPGYPVDGALDKAAIYVGPDAVFVECRATNGVRQELEGHSVIHFTATRRTREEIIAKMRGSGHGDDPNYAFEEWIEHVLPNIKPGFTYRFSQASAGLHMYRVYQVWPACRSWTVDEWQELPERVKPYLARP